MRQPTYKQPRQTPLWWPPKLSDQYNPLDSKDVQIAKALGGWFAFFTIYGSPPALILTILYFATR